MLLVVCMAELPPSSPRNCPHSDRRSQWQLLLQPLRPIWDIWAAPTCSTWRCQSPLLHPWLRAQRAFKPELCFTSLTSLRDVDVSQQTQTQSQCDPNRLRFKLFRLFLTIHLTVRHCMYANSADFWFAPDARLLNHPMRPMHLTEKKGDGGLQQLCAMILQFLYHRLLQTTTCQ